MSVAAACALASLLAWLCLALGRSGLWREAPHLGPAERSAAQPWPAVVAVVPARNEADPTARRSAATASAGCGF
jgi:hypothetical protein